MDHHCPFVNNCVGLENYRYFLLFIFYLTLGLGYMAITMMALRHHYLFKEHKSLMSFVGILDFVLFFTMLGFAVWNWFLAFYGSTTIEFWKADGLGIDKREASLKFPRVSDNLYRVFGTHKFFRIFSPSFRNVPFTGLEWSFKFKDEGYDCDGLLADSRDRDFEALGFGNKQSSQG